MESGQNPSESQKMEKRLREKKSARSRTRSSARKAAEDSDSSTRSRSLSAGRTRHAESKTPARSLSKCNNKSFHPDESSGDEFVNPVGKLNASKNRSGGKDVPKRHLARKNSVKKQPSTTRKIPI